MKQEADRRDVAGIDFWALAICRVNLEKELVMGGQTKIFLQKSARSSESVLADCVNMVMMQQMREVRASRAARKFEVQSDASFSRVNAALRLHGSRR